MGFWAKVITLFRTQIVAPTAYGFFHFICVLSVVALCVLAVFLGRKYSRKALKITLAITSIIMILFEVYKQLVYSTNVVDSNVVFSYSWAQFPFQLCSTPMYVMLIASLCKKGGVEKSLMAYLALFSFFGGLVTYIYPQGVLSIFSGINIQTMVHHGLQIVIAVLVLSFYRKELNHKFFLSSLPVFGVLLAIAMALNLFMPKVLPKNTYFNMFFISPYFTCPLALLDMIYPAVPYFVFLMIYIFGFILAAYVIFIIAYGFNKLVLRHDEKRATKKTLL